MNTMAYLLKGALKGGWDAVEGGIEGASIPYLAPIVGGGLAGAHVGRNSAKTEGDILPMEVGGALIGGYTGHQLAKPFKAFKRRLALPLAAAGAGLVTGRNVKNLFDLKGDVQKEWSDYDASRAGEASLIASLRKQRARNKPLQAGKVALAGAPLAMLLAYTLKRKRDDSLEKEAQWPEGASPEIRKLYESYKSDPKRGRGYLETDMKTAPVKLKGGKIVMDPAHEKKMLEGASKDPQRMFDVWRFILSEKSPYGWRSPKLRSAHKQFMGKTVPYMDKHLKNTPGYSEEIKRLWVPPKPAAPAKPVAATKPKIVPSK
jgi:hypothetical protein